MSKYYEVQISLDEDFKWSWIIVDDCYHTLAESSVQRLDILLTTLDIGKALQHINGGTTPFTALQEGGEQ